MFKSMKRIIKWAGKRNGVKTALRAFVRVCGAEIVWCRRDRAWSDRAYDIQSDHNLPDFSPPYLPTCTPPSCFNIV